MPFIILILSALGGALWFWVRNNPRDAINAAQDAVTTIKNAPRRLAFRQQTNEHPVEGIDDSRIAIGVMAQSFIELDDLPTKDQREHLNAMLKSKLYCSNDEAQEILVLSRWLIDQCKGPAQAILRVARRLYKLEGDKSWTVLQEVLAELVEGELSSTQIGAIDDIRLALRK